MARTVTFEVCGLSFHLQRSGVRRDQFRLCDEALAGPVTEFRAANAAELLLETERHTGLPLPGNLRRRILRDLGLTPGARGGMRGDLPPIQAMTFEPGAGSDPAGIHSMPG